jgi:probable rRNA maturation factor
MKINLYNQYGEINFDYRSAIKAISQYFKIRKSVSLILVNKEEIQKLNMQYRGLDRKTDVLSFESGEKIYLGEIFICVDKVKSQAEEYGHSLEREFAFLLVHGLLHLQGYDHQNPEDEEKMKKKQEEILNSLNYRRSENEFC